MWRKSSYSAVNNCLEVNTGWHKSSHSNPTGNSLEAEWKSATGSAEASSVQAMQSGFGFIAFRESDQPDIIITTTPEKWQAFIKGVKDGEFDLA